MDGVGRGGGGGEGAGTVWERTAGEQDTYMCSVIVSTSD